jgi:flagellar assembly protein FliH
MRKLPFDPSAAGDMTPGLVISREATRAAATAHDMLHRATSEAERILDAAKTQAAEIEAEAAARVRASEEEGYAAGFATGQREAISRLLAQREPRHAAASSQIATARDIIGQALDRLLHHDLRREALDGAINRALAYAVNAKPLRLLINDDDAGHITGSLADLETRNVDVIRDVSLARGSCVLETPDGRVDASLSIAVETLLESLTGPEGEPAEAAA